MMTRKRRRHFLVEGAEEALADSPFIRTKVKDQVFAWSFTLMIFYAHARTHFSTKCQK